MTFSVACPTPETPEAIITSSSFWPGIDPVRVRQDHRIDTGITPERLKAAVIEAIATTNGALYDFRTQQMLAGCATLAEVPAEEIDGTSVNVHRYYRAVGSLAKALLLERYRDIDTSPKGDRKADALTDPIDDCRRDHLNAIADIQRKSRSTVELI